MLASDNSIFAVRWRPLASVLHPTNRELAFLTGLTVVLFGALTLQTPYLTAGAILWFAGLGLLVTACWHRVALASLVDFAVSRSEAVGVALVVLVAAVFRFWSLDTMPIGIHIDEAVMGLIARDILQGRGPHPFGFAFISDPAPLMYVKAAFMAMLGDGIFPQRVLTACSGLGGVVALWLLARPLFGRSVALVATAILAVTPSHVVFSRLALTIIEIPFLGILAVALIWHGLRTKLSVWHLIGGMMLGFGQYANFGARAYVLAVAGIYAAHMLALLRDRAPWRDWPGTIRGGVMAAVGMVAVAAPQLLFVRDDPAQLIDRLRFRSVFRRWDQAVDIHQTSDPIGVLVGQAILNVRAFIDVPDRGPFYEFANQPLLPGFVAALFIFGAAIAIWRVRDPRYSTLLLICGGVLLGGIFSAGAPEFHRLVPMVPIACVLAAIGVVAATGWIDRRLARASVRIAGLMSIAVPIFVVGLTGFDTTSDLFLRQPAELPWQPHSAWARWIAEQPTDAPIFIAGAPDVRAWDERLRFLAGDRILLDMTNPTESLQSIRSQPGPSLIALSPKLADWVPLLRQQLPHATFQSVDGPDGRPTLIAVSVPAAPREPAQAGGLRGEVLVDGPDTLLAVERIDPAVAFRESDRLAGQRPYRARWTGTLVAEKAGPHRLEVFTDGAVELIVDGATVIDAKTSTSARSLRFDGPLTRGDHSVEIRYRYVRGPGTIELRWQPPDGKRSLIPPSALRPT